MEKLQGLNARGMFEMLSWPDDKFMDWMKDVGLLHRDRSCPSCSVNHSDPEHPFVDQSTGAHTNTIESTWQKFKSRHKKEHGTARTLLNTYVEQFLWRKKFGGADCLYHLWSQIVEMFPIEP